MSYLPARVQVSWGRPMDVDGVDFLHVYRYHKKFERCDDYLKYGKKVHETNIIGPGSFIDEIEQPSSWEYVVFAVNEVSISPCITATHVVYPDDDKDGIEDSVDPFLNDTDNDGIENKCDADYFRNRFKNDNDKDGIIDDCDPDDDNDGILDEDDRFPWHYNRKLKVVIGEHVYEEEYPDGANVGLIASPNLTDGEEFLGWEGEVTDKTELITSILMDKDQEVTATFGGIYFNLTVEQRDEANNPGEYGVVMGSGPKKYDKEAAVVALDGENFEFKEWQGDVVPNDGSQFGAGFSFLMPERDVTIYAIYKVGRKNQIINLNFNDPVLLSDESMFLDLFAATSGLQVRYESEDESIATVNNTTGELTFLKGGFVRIKAFQDGNDEWRPAEASALLEITDDLPAPVPGGGEEVIDCGNFTCSVVALDTEPGNDWVAVLPDEADRLLLEELILCQYIDNQGNLLDMNAGPHPDNGVSNYYLRANAIRRALYRLPSNSDTTLLDPPITTSPGEVVRINHDEVSYNDKMSNDYRVEAVAVGTVLKHPGYDEPLTIWDVGYGHPLTVAQKIDDGLVFPGSKLDPYVKDRFVGDIENGSPRALMFVELMFTTGSVFLESWVNYKISQSNSLPNPNNGSFVVNVSGGVAPYKFNFFNGDVLETEKSSARQDDLSAGVYSVQVTDANGCKTKIVNVTIN